MHNCCLFAHEHMPTLTVVADTSVRPLVACLNVNGCLARAAALAKLLASARHGMLTLRWRSRTLVFFGAHVVTGLVGLGDLGGSFMEAPENTSPDAVSVLSCSRLGTVLLHFAPHVYH